MDPEKIKRYQTTLFQMAKGLAFLVAGGLQQMDLTEAEEEEVVDQIWSNVLELLGDMRFHK